VRIFCPPVSINSPRLPQHRPAKSNRSTYEINTDGRDVAFGIGVIGESEQQARLSNTGVSDEEELEEIIVSIWVRSCRSARWGIVGYDEAANAAGRDSGITKRRQ
jgi:hypothetical protein